MPTLGSINPIEISRDDAASDDNDKQILSSLPNFVDCARQIEINQILLYKSNTHIGSIINKIFF